MTKHIISETDWQEVCNGIMCKKCPFKKDGSCKIETYIRNQPVYEEKPEEGEQK